MRFLVRSRWVYVMNENIKNASCRACETRVFDRFAESAGWKLIRCGSCASVNYWPQLSAEEQKHLHLTEEYATSEYFENRQENQLRAKRKASAITSLAQKFENIKTMKVLEVGAGSGELLEEISLLGHDVTGVEISEFHAQKLRNKGLKCYQGGFLE